MKRLMVGSFAAAVTLATTLVACTGNEAAVKRIDQLTPAQLEHAFCTVEALPKFGRVEKAELPAEFRELGATFLRRRGIIASLHVSGAVDDVVSMEFLNVGRPGFEKSIKLIPGERQDARTLWKAPLGFRCDGPRNAG